MNIEARAYRLSQVVESTRAKKESCSMIADWDHSKSDPPPLALDIQGMLKDLDLKVHVNGEVEPVALTVMFLQSDAPSVVVAHPDFFGPGLHYPIMRVTYSKRGDVEYVYSSINPDLDLDLYPLDINVHLMAVKALTGENPGIAWGLDRRDILLEGIARHFRCLLVVGERQKDSWFWPDYSGWEGLVKELNCQSKDRGTRLYWKLSPDMIIYGCIEEDGKKYPLFAFGSNSKGKLYYSQLPYRYEDQEKLSLHIRWKEGDDPYFYGEIQLYESYRLSAHHILNYLATLGGEELKDFKTNRVKDPVLRSRVEGIRSPENSR